MSNIAIWNGTSTFTTGSTPFGFYDAFSETENWYTPRYLAIDQGPIVVMMENYRTGLLWNLFMSCPEIKAGLTKLGFESPALK